MKNSDIRLLSEQEIEDKISSEQANLQKFKFAHAVSPVENPSSIKKTKRLIARLYTELRIRDFKVPDMKDDTKSEKQISITN